jgi:hypothetical protein
VVIKLLLDLGHFWVGKLSDKWVLVRPSLYVSFKIFLYLQLKITLLLVNEYDNWCGGLNEEHRLRMPENKVLKRFMDRKKARRNEELHNLYVGLEVLTAVIMKGSIFWGITPCSPVKVVDVSEENVAAILRIEK